MQFSANLGFLWTDLPLPEAIRAAARSGFDAVECHWPYDTPASQVRAALQETQMDMLGINTRKGNVGENGLTALPGREAEARAAIDEALEYASAIDAKAVHVMAGATAHPKAHQVFCHNLRYACQQATLLGIQILIEPLNPYDASDYFLHSAWQAKEIIQQLQEPALRLMFDCYHQQIIHGDVCRNFELLKPWIGHVQMASVPARTRPDQGELYYPYVLSRLTDLGWKRPIGAEYKTEGPTESTLGWMMEYRESR